MDLTTLAEDQAIKLAASFGMVKRTKKTALEALAKLPENAIVQKLAVMDIVVATGADETTPVVVVTPVAMPADLQPHECMCDVTTSKDHKFIYNRWYYFTAGVTAHNIPVPVAQHCEQTLRKKGGSTALSNAQPLPDLDE